MGIIEMVKTIKKVESKSIILIEIGKFIYSYGKDAYIISYIFNYKIKILKENNNTYVCAFPRDKLKKIMATLENKKINYLILDRKNNYREDEKYDNKNLNRYDEYLEKSIKYVKRKNQIDEINNYLDEKRRLLEKLIAKLKIIDFLLNICYDNKIINSKKYLKFGEKIDDISKFTVGWIKSI